MLLEDYLNKTSHFRRVLIVSDPANGQALIRMHEKKTGAIVRNVSCMFVAQMSNVLYRYFLAENGILFRNDNVNEIGINKFQYDNIVAGNPISVTYKKAILGVEFIELKTNIGE